MAAIFFQMGRTWFRRVLFGNDTLATIWSQTQKQTRTMGHVIRTAKVICSMLTMLMSHHPTAELEQNQQQQDQNPRSTTHTHTHTGVSGC